MGQLQHHDETCEEYPDAIKSYLSGHIWILKKTHFFSIDLEIAQAQAATHFHPGRHLGLKVHHILWIGFAIYSPTMVTQIAYPQGDTCDTWEGTAKCR